MFADSLRVFAVSFCHSRARGNPVSFSSPTEEKAKTLDPYNLIRIQIAWIPDQVGDKRRG